MASRPQFPTLRGRAALFRFLTLCRCPLRSAAPSGPRLGVEVPVYDRILPGIALFGPGAFPPKGEGGFARARRRARFGSVRRRSQSPDRPAGRRYSGIEDRDVLLGRVLRRLFLRAVHDGADVVAFSFDDGFGRGENVPRLVYEHSGIRIAG